MWPLPASAKDFTQAQGAGQSQKEKYPSRSHPWPLASFDPTTLQQCPQNPSTLKLASGSWRLWEDIQVSTIRTLV